MAANVRRAALKSLVLVCCLSSGLAAATPKQMPRNVQSDLWSQVELVVRGGPAHWLNALRALFGGRSAEALRARP